ncbi:Lovastatin diketide synthase LovF [Daldinia childiae]|uniref:Lovastatin diketide synthase LovF n=1 Tax=Daldinia childiae TaxID=326645 RepID=UPI0014449F07|nr:Lovastatin diketide synthase LovF [Daldinia childiae]KAF3067292.1 Lovastatin diketide synthase LovF [Daldinia childiae]
MLEQPTLRYSVLNIGTLQQFNFTMVCENALKAFVAKYDKNDCDEKKLNTLIEANPARLSIDRVGMMYMLDSEEFTVVSTLLLVYGTALYVINKRAHAIIHTTAGSEAKRDYFINEMGVLPPHVLSSRNPSFVQAVMQATSAEFGRFVKIGKRELIDAGKLDMRAFLRKATFTAFDLSDLFYTQDPFHRLVSRAKQLVSRLEEAGATVGIICGDVSKITNVTAAASTCMATGRRIRSVIQAAMGLYEA